MTDPLLYNQLKNLRGTISDPEDDGLLTFLGALCASPKDYIAENNDYAKDCMFLSSLFYICGLRQEALDATPTLNRQKLTLFSAVNVKNQIRDHLDPAKISQLKGDIFKETGYYIRVTKVMKVVRELQLDEYYVKINVIGVAETKIQQNLVQYGDCRAMAKYDPTSPSKIYEEMNLFESQSKIMSDFEVPGFDLITFSDHFNQIIVRINGETQTTAQCVKDDITLKRMQPSLDSLYAHKRALLIYSTLFMNELKLLGKKGSYDEYQVKLGYPKTDIQELQAKPGVKTMMQNAPIPDIQFKQSYAEIIAGICKEYTTFTEHSIMKFACTEKNWLDTSFNVKKAYTSGYTSTFDFGKSGEFYLGGELGTFSTTGCAASGGATLASVASVSSRDAGVPGDSGALSMPVVEEPLKTAKRAPKKIRFDVDARYPSIAEDASGGESAA
jgi:hypothetical protein